MATKRHIRSLITAVFAAALVFPPLMSTVAAGFGVDLAHHHCDEHGIETLADHGDGEHDDAASGHDHAETGDHDPFQCDQCHFAFAALPADLIAPVPATVGLPDEDSVVRLRAADPPFRFKPPIT
jgi:hypothetical protein